MACAFATPFSHGGLVAELAHRDEGIPMVCRRTRASLPLPGRMLRRPYSLLSHLSASTSRAVEQTFERAERSAPVARSHLALLRFRVGSRRFPRRKFHCFGGGVHGSPTYTCSGLCGWSRVSGRCRAGHRFADP